LCRYKVGVTVHTMTATPTPTIGELDFLGARCRVLAEGQDLGLVDMVEVPPGDMPPLHVHRRTDEGFLVLSGEVTFFLPGREVRLQPGGWVLAPRGIPHAYLVGDAPARFLVVSLPGGFEAFVRDVASLEEPTPEALAATAAQHDIEILGPPGARP
jgi:quercetin dioxygenase-like cupin family protein